MFFYPSPSPAKLKKLSLAFLLVLLFVQSPQADCTYSYSRDKPKNSRVRKVLYGIGLASSIAVLIQTVPAFCTTSKKMIKGWNKLSTPIQSDMAYESTSEITEISGINYIKMKKKDQFQSLNHPALGIIELDLASLGSMNNNDDEDKVLVYLEDKNESGFNDLIFHVTHAPTNKPIRLFLYYKEDDKSTKEPNNIIIYSSTPCTNILLYKNISDDLRSFREKGKGPFNEASRNNNISCSLIYKEHLLFAIAGPKWLKLKILWYTKATWFKQIALIIASVLLALYYASVIFDQEHNLSPFILFFGKLFHTLGKP